MAQRKSLLPREGFHFEVLATLFKQTLLNPTITLPLWLLSQYTESGRAIAFDHPKAASRLKLLLGLGVARYVNGILNRGRENNWTRATPNWNQEFVLITGGSDGIGALLVKQFATKGVKVVILDIQEPQYELPNSNIFFVKVDLTDGEALVAASDRVKQQYGDPSVLVLNAGITNRHNILDTPDHLLRRIFDLNVISQYRLVREFLPAMVRANHGLVCTTASLAGYVTCPGMVDYNSTKAAVIAFYEGLTAEIVVRYNAPAIRTVCICPNFVDTKLSEGFNNESTFVSVTLHPETVAEIQFNKIWNWEGGLVSVPNFHRNGAMHIRSFPTWLQSSLRLRLRRVMLGVEVAEQERLKRLSEQQQGDISESIVKVDKDISEGSTMFA